MIGGAVNFQSANGATNYIINDRFNQPLLWQQSPFYYIRLVTPEHSGAEISYESHPLPQAIGERSGDVFRRGKGITLAGEIEAMSLGYLEAGADFLGQMFADTSKRKLIWTRKVDQIQVYYECRVNNDLVISEEITGADKYIWTWVVGLRADDPRTRRLDNGTVYPTWQQ
jgi:hypothetical protein